MKNLPPSGDVLMTGGSGGSRGVRRAGHVVPVALQDRGRGAVGLDGTFKSGKCRVPAESLLCVVYGALSPAGGSVSGLRSQVSGVRCQVSGDCHDGSIETDRPAGGDASGGCSGSGRPQL